jgi:hypothetical protein
VVIANPLQVRAIARTKIKTDKIDAAGELRRFHSWCPSATGRLGSRVEALGTGPC